MIPLTFQDLYSRCGKFQEDTNPKKEEKVLEGTIDVLDSEELELFDTILLAS